MGKKLPAACPVLGSRTIGVVTPAIHIAIKFQLTNVAYQRTSPVNLLTNVAETLLAAAWPVLGCRTIGVVILTIHIASKFQLTGTEYLWIQLLLLLLFDSLF